MNSRERIDRLLHLEEADHVGFRDGIWKTTIEKWETQGFPKGTFIEEHFGMDLFGIGVDTSPKYDEMIFEKGDSYVISRDRYGVKQKRWTGEHEGIPLHIEPPFTNLEEFEERIEPLLDPDYPIRISSPSYPFRHEIEEMYRKFQENFYVYAGFYGTFEYTRHICGGTKKALRHMMIDPKLTKRMYEVLARLFGAISSAMCDAGADCAWVFDDLGFADGPFFSPENYRKYVKPAHEAITKPFRKRGLPALLHTDGNVNLLIPDILDAGFTGLHPLEVNAGMDVIQLKESYGDRLAFLGNIDKNVLHTNDLARIKEEVIPKVKVAMEGGGYVLCSDHSISPQVDLDTFTAFSKMGIKYGSYS
jgi:uroporphyrinogen decarboxylase